MQLQSKISAGFPGRPDGPTGRVGTVGELHGPAGPRRRLGAELRRLRVKADLTLDEVAVRMTCSTSKISRLETGKGIPKLPDVNELIRIYGVTAEPEREMLHRLVAEGRSQGWWESYTDGMSVERFMLDQPNRYPALETDAAAVRAFDYSALHGLLQTPDYTRGVMKAFLPRHGDWEIERLVTMRQQRQRALASGSDPMQLSVVIDEGVLCRRVGDAATMDAALGHVQKMGHWPNVTIRVLPFERGIHRAHAGSFVLLDIPVTLGSDVVYIEGHAGDTYLEHRSDVDRYNAVFADVSAVALDVAESRSMIEDYRGRYAGGESIR